MKQTNFFLLRENDGTRIAVVVAANSEELNKKVTLAINNHFDVETKSTIELNHDDYQVKGGTFRVILDNETSSEKILIETITLY